MTGLGLLTFLAHGETPASQGYGETVEKAIRYLVNSQNVDGTFPKAGSNYVYGHAIATYAISEAYGLTLIPSLKRAMNRSVKIIVDGQQRGGGWDYRYRKTARRDTSVAGWQIQALKAASIARCSVPGIQKALDRAIVDLTKFQSETGRFGYSNTPGSANAGVRGGLTSIGALCMQLLGHAEDDACKRAIKYLNEIEIEVNWDRRGVRSKWPLYGWYYITQAKFHDGRSFRKWNRKFAREFIRAQNTDGSWTPPGNEMTRGKVYGTTLAALTLQVYYRLLPTYQQKSMESEDLSEVDDEEEDLIIVI